MVFNKGFDNTIWMILCSDRKYRKDIAKFIYNLPKEIYDGICNQLNEYNYDIDNNDYECRVLKKLIRDNNFINNYYCIEIEPYRIKINLKRWDSANDKLNEDIELVLYYFNVNELYNMDDYICIGNYSFKNSKLLSPFSSLITFIGDSRLYEIYDIDDNNLMISISDDCELDSKVNLNIMPYEYGLDNFKDGRSVTRLVRGRKMR